MKEMTAAEATLVRSGIRRIQDGLSNIRAGLDEVRQGISGQEGDSYRMNDFACQTIGLMANTAWQALTHLKLWFRIN